MHHHIMFNFHNGNFAYIYLWNSLEFFRKEIWTVEMLARKQILTDFMFRNVVNKFQTGMVFFQSTLYCMMWYQIKNGFCGIILKSWGLIEWYIKIIAYSTGTLHVVHSYDILRAFPSRNIFPREMVTSKFSKKLIRKVQLG